MPGYYRAVPPGQNHSPIEAPRIMLAGVKGVQRHLYRVKRKTRGQHLESVWRRRNDSSNIWVAKEASRPCVHTFVIKKTRLRRPLRPLPIQFSDLPRLYSRQVVEKGDATVDRLVHDLDGRLLVFSVAQVVPAQAQHGNLIAMVAEVFLGGSTACHTSFNLQQI